MVITTSRPDLSGQPDDSRIGLGLEDPKAGCLSVRCEILNRKWILNPERTASI